MKTSTLYQPLAKNSTRELLSQTAEEIKAILVEGEFNARWTLLEAYYKAGHLIEVLIGITDMGVTEATARLAVEVGRSERTLYYALKMARTYDDMNKLPEGKNISWNKLITKYLTEPKDKKPIQENLQELVCPNCGHKFTAKDKLGGSMRH